MPKVIDLTGQKFGRLTVQCRIDKEEDAHVTWLCSCECGGTKEVRGQSLRQGRCKSCGCLHKESTRPNTLPKGEAAFNILFERYKRDAKVRGHTWSLSKDDFRRITSEDCHYCGSKPDTIYNRKGLNGGYLYNGVDRVVNTEGYVKNNCVAACSTCNYMKGTLTYETYIQKCMAVSKKFLSTKEF